MKTTAANLFVWPSLSATITARRSTGADGSRDGSRRRRAFESVFALLRGIRQEAGHESPPCVRFVQTDSELTRPAAMAVPATA